MMSSRLRSVGSSSAHVSARRSSESSGAGAIGRQYTTSVRRVTSRLAAVSGGAPGGEGRRRDGGSRLSARATEFALARQRPRARHPDAVVVDARHRVRGVPRRGRDAGSRLGPAPARGTAAAGQCGAHDHQPRRGLRDGDPDRRAVAGVRLRRHHRAARDRCARGGHDAPHRAGDRPPVVVGGALSGLAGSDRQRDPHPGRRPRARERHVGGRHPQLLGTRAQPQGRLRARLPERAAPAGRQARPLPRPVRGVLRAPARAHVVLGRGRPARPFPDVARPGGHERGALRRRFGRARRAGVHRPGLLELPSDPRHRGTRHRRPRSDSYREPLLARRADDPQHRTRPRGLDLRSPARQARQQDAGAQPRQGTGGRPRRLSAGAALMATATAPAARQRYERLERLWTERPGLVGWLTTTDHKRIGLLYLFATMAFALAGGVEAILMRTQLIGPDRDLISPAAYSELMTMHGVTMIFLVVVPISIGAFGNYLVPLMIGARDMAFPRMNALSFWIFVASGLLMYTGLAIGDAPNAGWFSYVPLASRAFDPGPGQDFYALGLIFNGISTTAAAINFIVTIFKLRAPGMSLNRMPLFCYAFLAVSFALVFALPPLNTALVFLEMDRRLGFHFFDIANGGDPILWQHLFWLFGHPEVYIIILPAFGIATSIIPTFTRRRMVAFPLVALAELLVAFIGFGVWAHHMFATGLPTTTAIYFAAASLIIVVPSAIQLFAWLATLITGTPEFQTPLLWIAGFITFFIVGGLSGVMFAAVPF